MSYNGNVRHGNEKGAQAAKVDAYQFHELQHIEAHPDSFRQGGAVPTLDARLGGPDHSLDIAVSHWSTMTFKCFPKHLEETRGVPNTMVDFLLNQLRVQYRSDVVCLCCDFVESGLE